MFHSCEGKKVGFKDTRVPGFLVLYYRRQLLVVSNQDKPLGMEQWPYTNRLADLGCFIHDAEIKLAAGEKGMFDAHTGSSHNKLDGEESDYLLWSCQKHIRRFL